MLMELSQRLFPRPAFSARPPASNPGDRQSWSSEGGRMGCRLAGLKEETYREKQSE